MLTGMTLASCFKDEPLNAECDIEEAYIHTDNPTEMFFQPSDTLVSVLSDKSVVSFKVRIGTDVSAIAPRFKLTEGATISPENGSIQDFSKGPVTYVVTSQDRQWSRTYQVEVKEDARTVGDTLKFDFESYELKENTYYEWAEENNTGLTWATGNSGYSFSPSMETEEKGMLPTMPEANGYNGKSVKLTTLHTGPLSYGFMGIYMAAGNLFIGEFDLTSAISGGKNGALKATRFGQPTNSKPVRITGYYKYKRGDNFYVNDVDKKTLTLIPERKDNGSIYAVLYKNHDDEGNKIELDGTNIFTSKYVVAKAGFDENGDLVKIDNTSEWTEFDFDFDYTSDIDLKDLANKGYSLAIVFSSSINGDKFEGAFGSTLYIDKVRVVCAQTGEQ